MPEAFAGGAERLARTGAGPNRSIVRPSGAAQGVGPDPDAGEEVALGVLVELVGIKVDDGSLVNNTWRDVSGGNEVAKPLCSIRFNLVVEGGHATPANNSSWSTRTAR